MVEHGILAKGVEEQSCLVHGGQKIYTGQQRHTLEALMIAGVELTHVSASDGRTDQRELGFQLVLFSDKAADVVKTPSGKAERRPGRDRAAGGSPSLPPSGTAVAPPRGSGYTPASEFSKLAAGALAAPAPRSAAVFIHFSLPAPGAGCSLCPPCPGLGPLARAGPRRPGAEPGVVRPAPAARRGGALRGAPRPRRPEGRSPAWCAPPPPPGGAEPCVVRPAPAARRGGAAAGGVEDSGRALRVAAGCAPPRAGDPGRAVPRPSQEGGCAARRVPGGSLARAPRWRRGRGTRPGMSGLRGLAGPGRPSIHIVALGNEGDAFHQDSRPSGLVRTYLGRSPLVSGDESSLLLNAAGAVARPVFTEYRASAFGNVKLVVHDCPVWDIFDSDWYTSRNLIGSADIIVIKYNVNDKFSFHEVKDNYIPVIKRALNSVSVIIAAVGTRQNEELPCTCPLCTSDRGSCVSTTEGIQLAKELGATYLELHSLDDFYIGKYFGGVLEYFMIQVLNQKTSEKMKKRKMSSSFHGLRPPQLEQPEKMPVLKAEASHYNSDLNNLLFCCQCVDVVFYHPDVTEVAEAHKVVLCAVSHVFMLLFNVKSPADIQDSSIVQATQDLFAINRESAFPGASQEAAGNPPLRVIVKDAVFCSCLSDILRFIYSGAFQWEELEEDIRKKLKDSGDVSSVIEKVKCILKTPGKINCLRNCKTFQARKPLWFYSTSLKFFLNKPMLADVVFEIQGSTVPAHRAILVARCEVMAAMFNGNYMEAKSVLIPVYGVSKETFLSFLEYLYTDSCCPAGIFQAMCLLICAEMYQVSRLQHICELFIITQLQSMPSRELASMSLDIVDLLKKAKFHHSDCLSTWLLHFIATNYLIFSQKPEFQDLSVEERSFVEKHRWPSNLYLKQLAEYRKYIHSRKCRCLVM
ncbi:rho-related BTB domain-containing protein 3 [Ctenodactylus gundi]